MGNVRVEARAMTWGRDAGSGSAARVELQESSVQLEGDSEAACSGRL